MNWRRVSAITRKDLREVTASRAVTVPMAVVPLVICILLPAAAVLVAVTGGASSLGNVEWLGKLVARYPVPDGFVSLVDRLLYVLLNYSFLPFFMIIPVMVSSIIAANSVVGEKERGTLETLLYTPVTNRELMLAKLLSSFLPAIATTIGSFLGYFAVANGIYWAFRAMLVVRSVVWIPALLLLAPAVALLGLSMSLLVSLKAKTYLEAQQLSGLVVLPFIALLYAQIGGLVVVGPLLVLVMGLVALAVSYIAYGMIGPRFNRERILMSL